MSGFSFKDFFTVVAGGSLVVPTVATATATGAGAATVAGSGLVSVVGTALSPLAPLVPVILPALPAVGTTVASAAGAEVLQEAKDRTTEAVRGALNPQSYGPGTVIYPLNETVVQPAKPSVPWLPIAALLALFA